MCTYTKKHLARISGISRDQLTQWDRHGLLRAERARVRGKISECAYTRAQAIGVMALAELRRSGVSQKRVRAASGTLPSGIDGGKFLVFDGWSLYPKSTAEDAVAFLAESRGGRVMKVDTLLARLGL